MDELLQIPSRRVEATGNKPGIGLGLRRGLGMLLSAGQQEGSGNERKSYGEYGDF